MAMVHGLKMTPIIEPTNLPCWRCFTTHAQFTGCYVPKGLEKVNPTFFLSKQGYKWFLLGTRNWTRTESCSNQNPLCDFTTGAIYSTNEVKILRKGIETQFSLRKLLNCPTSLAKKQIQIIWNKMSAKRLSSVMHYSKEAITSLDSLHRLLSIWHLHNSFTRVMLLQNNFRWNFSSLLGTYEPNKRACLLPPISRLIYFSWIIPHEHGTIQNRNPFCRALCKTL